MVLKRVSPIYGFDPEEELGKPAGKDKFQRLHVGIGATRRVHVHVHTKAFKE